MHKSLKFLAALTLIYLALPQDAGAKAVKTAITEQYMLKADVISNDNVTNLTTAKGNVIIFSSLKSLEADMVQFNQKTKQVFAHGNVRMTQKPNNKKFKETIIYGDYVELTCDLKDGFIKNVGARLGDNSVVVASQSNKIGEVTHFKQVKYTPCKVCRETGQASTWHLAAQQASWLEKERDIIYKDVVLNFYDMPVLYLPYFRHPDPGVKRRSGIMVADFGSNKNLGMFVRTPYFQVIDQSQDILLTPLATTKGGVFINPDYRFNFKRGHMRFKSSIGHNNTRSFFHKSNHNRNSVINDSKQKKHTVQGHADFNMNYNINEIWRIKTTVLRVTDKKYFGQYQFYGNTSPAALNSNITLEGFYPRTYLKTFVQHTQSTVEDDRQRMLPVILPSVDIHYESTPQMYGSWWNCDSNLLTIHRKAGQNTLRYINALGWSLPMNGLIGDKFLLTLSARADIYDTKNTSDSLGYMEKTKLTDTKSRFFPQARMLWELPFYNRWDKLHCTIGPEVSFVTSPKMSRSNFPNEDNYLREPTDSSLFNMNRFQGYDVPDDGTRLNYGFKATLFQSKLYNLDTFIGQTYTFTDTNANLKNTGFEENNSDLVGRTNLNIKKYINLRWRYRISRESLSIKRNEIGASVGPKNLKVSADYLNLPKNMVERNNSDPTSAKFRKDVAHKQLQFAISMRPHKFWTIKFMTIQALGDNKQSLAKQGSLEFQNECFSTDLNISRTGYVSKNLKPDTTIWARISFKNLGSISSPRFGDPSRGGLTQPKIKSD